MRLPRMFKQEFTGVGATLEKRWKLCAFEGIKTTCVEQQSLWIWHCLDPARAVQCGPRRSGAGPAQDLYGAIRAWLQLHLWRSLVSGNVIVYQFPKTNKASYCDRSVCYENQRFHSHDGKTLKYATFENSSPSKIFKVNDGVAMVVARLQSCCICNL